MNTDPIADMLTRIRNANMVSHETVEVPTSKLKVELAKLLKNEGFIVDYKVDDSEKFSKIVITLKYDENHKPVITNLQRVSTPGLKTYSKSKNLPKVLGGMGVAVISTSKGLMSDRKARKENLGGEILCYVWQRERAKGEAFRTATESRRRKEQTRRKRANKRRERAKGEKFSRLTDFLVNKMSVIGRKAQLL